MRRASELAQPSEQRYGEIRLSYGRILEQTADEPGQKKTNRERAEEVYRETVQQKPYDVQVRLSLAELIGKNPTRREEAIALLSESYPPNPDLTGIRGTLVRRDEIQSDVTLVDLLLDQIPLVKEKTEQDKLLARVQETFDRVQTKAGDIWPIIRSKGRIQLAKNQPIEAIQTLNRALSLMPPPPEVLSERYELMMLLARTYHSQRQTGEAKKLLRSIIVVYPNYAPARVLLTELLVNENYIKGSKDATPPYGDGARAQVDELGKLLPPDSILLMRIRLLTYDKDTEKDKIKALYSKLPEKSRDDRIDKAQMSVQLGDRADAIRLVESCRAEAPGDQQIVTLLAQLYTQDQKKDKALAVVDAGIAANPQNKVFPILKAQIVGDRAGSRTLSKETIMANPDEFTRELGLANYYRSADEPDEMIKHLLRAEQLQAENPRVREMLFSYYIAKKDWDKAAGHMEWLAKRNEDHAEGRIYRVSFATAQGDLTAAYTQAQELVKTRAEFAQSYVVLARVLQGLGRFDEAISNYLLALERQTENLDALRGIIDCYYALNKISDARKAIDHGRQLSPNSRMFKEMEMQWELAYGDPTTVIAPRQEELDRNPEVARNWAMLGIAYASASTGKNVKPDDAKQYMKKARDIFAKAMAKWPDDRTLVLSYADSSLRCEDFPAAEKAVLAYTQREPLKGQPEAALIEADFYQRAGKQDKSEELLRNYLVQKPTATDVQLRLVSQLVSQKRLDDALKALEPNSDSPRIIGAKVELLVNNGRLDEAAKVLDAAPAGANNVDLQKMRVLVSISAGNLPDARQRVAKLILANPNDAGVVYYHGLVELRDPHGDTSVAVADFLKVLELVPSSNEARSRLADAFIRRNQIDDAIRALEAAVRASPADRALRLRLLELYRGASPPRVVDAEHLLEETRQLPQFANDVELLHQQALIHVDKKNFAKALELVNEALKQNPDNPALQHTQLNIMFESKAYG
ncbi:MAG: tetratricopeptide repeat protein, partial [Tepidisphaeraceae bacterium]